MTFEETEKQNREHFENLNLKCPKCGGDMKYVMKYDDYPQMFSGRCNGCGRHTHFSTNGKFIRGHGWNHEELKK